MIHPCAVGLPQSVVDYLDTYFTGTDNSNLLTIDIILALLRSPRADCSAAAERLAGVRIERIPPRQLIPPPRVPPQPRVRFVRTSPPDKMKWLGNTTIDRLRSVRIGMTMDQLRTRGWNTDSIWWARKCGLLDVA